MRTELTLAAALHAGPAPAPASTQTVNLVDEAQTADLGEALRNDTMDSYVEEYDTEYAP